MKQVQQRGKKFTATVRLNGHSISSTFPKKQQANEWANRVEIAIKDEIVNPANKFRKDDFIAKKYIKKISVKEILKQAKEDNNTPYYEWTLLRCIKKYKYEELDKLNGAKQALLRLQMWEKTDLANMKLTDITPDIVHEWKINRKIKKGNKYYDPSPSTIRNDLYRLSVIFETARKPKTKHGWGLKDLKNPVKEILLPSPDEGRDRRLHGNEEDRMRDAIKEGPHVLEMLAFFEIALATGMRKSEILKATKSEVIEGRMGWSIRKPKTKNGTSRTIHLSERAKESVMLLLAENSHKTRLGYLFTVSSTTIDNTWRTARERAGCPDLRMHDLRHEAISRLADAGLSIGALSSMSGHKTSQMLLRYVNAKESDIREKLALIS
ncbi:site-specific integrase [Gluconobacter cerinus]|uniref:site-specific integrase n=1 Tax=Gluconobacter cerinus TaxID=38307 RepID=UPI001B8D1447|nr:site-specific integrase [Gluconobacter cerinus]MBS1035549.1 site-specific integrase [Gluconobacter cerinus]